MEDTERESEVQGTEKDQDLLARLVICGSDGKLQEVPLKDELSIGSGTEEGILTLPSVYMTRLHGKFYKKAEQFFYQDMGSRCGTSLNGVKIGTGALTGKDCVALEDQDVLRIEGGAFDEQNQEQIVVIIFRKKYVENVQWRTIDLKNETNKYYISRFDESVGKDEVFLDNMSIPELPKHHATMYMKDEKWMLHDDNTKYGIYLNNQKMTQDMPLEQKDVVRIGNTLFLFQDNQLTYSHRDSVKNQLMIHIEERSVWNFFRKKILLEDIDLTITPGDMVLILGGSGAGKTTFINAVMGYEKAKGTIKEGDRDIYRNYNQMKYEIGFVPQQDLLRGEDTVVGTLDNAAEMKLPKNASKSEREERIAQVLEMFGLDRERETLVEKLSGGQRKRLSIAVEFIADPSLFFLDEPDSGLDGIMSRGLMENLRHIADQDKIVIVITHSPDRVGDLFDKVVVLAKSNEDSVGHLAFYGLTEEALEFFDAPSLEGIVKRINRTDEGGEGRSDEFIKKFQELQAK